MEMSEQQPELLLRAGAGGMSGERRGKLKIFFGYAVGVGKTSAMLWAAQQAKARGADVVAGYIGPSGPEADKRAGELERLPAGKAQQRGSAGGEFDIDAALKRKPDLILIDELAHTNAPGSRHMKRYQDVQELLKAGINVYTTVNVQDIESLNDTVASITGMPVRERIPDSVFDQADQVEMVDIEPKNLLERMEEGGADREKQGRSAAAEYFTVEKLTALREIALRRCADRVKLITEADSAPGSYYTDEHILVCVSSSPSNAKIIRAAARMAKAFRGRFTALFVQTADAAAMSGEDGKRLRENMRLAEQLGAAVETGYGEDVPYQIAEFARLSGVSKIVVGRSSAARKSMFSKPSLTDRLIAAAPNMDIYVIPDAASGSGGRERKRQWLQASAMPVRDIGKTIVVLLAATLVSYLFYELGFTEANIISVYIFGVLVVSVITTSRFCSLISSLVSVLVFNFFFTVPRYTFRFYDSAYVVTFLIMFMIALLTGSLAAKLKENARQSARAAFRTRILFETNQLLQKAEDEQAVINAAAGQIIRLLNRDIVIYLPEGDGLSKPSVYRTADSSREELDSEKEEAAALWVYRNNKHAGATTDTLSDTRCMYLAIRMNRKVYGVVGIAMEGIPLEAFENSVLLSILGECALAIENIRNAREKEEAAIIAKNEQLRANLLRTISHDLRTPLTSISGNASNLLSNYRKLDDGARERIFTDIYEDSMWLINLVENLLAVTRLEDGQVRLHQSVELMDEVVAEALRHTSRKSKSHTIRVSSAQELILAKIDARLVVQVLINLTDNAIKYTQEGSCIEIHTEQKDGWVVVSVSDNGPGIPDEQKMHVFDMFYSGANKLADSRRSLGLGLSLCRSIVNAHGGTITVSDNHPEGTVFTFTLPAGEVELHE